MEMQNNAVKNISAGTTNPHTEHELRILDALPVDCSGVHHSQIKIYPARQCVNQYFRNRLVPVSLAAPHS